MPDLVSFSWPPTEFRNKGLIFATKSSAKERIEVLMLKPCGLLAFLIIVLILGGCGGNGGNGGSGDGGGGAEGTISLAWDSNTEPELEGYQVYYGNPKR